METYDLIPYSLLLPQQNLSACSLSPSPEQKNFSEHSHQNVEFFILLQGDVEMMVDGVPHPLRENDLLVIPAGHPHWIRLRGAAPYARAFFNVSPDYLRELGLCDFAEKLDRREPCRVNLTDTPFLQSLPQISHIAATAIDKEAQVALFRERLLSLYLSMLSRSERRDATQSDALAERAVQYINTHLEADLSIGAIAEQFYISGSYLCKAFRRKIGIPLMHYVNRQRILRAKKLILDSVPLKEVYLRCGYDNYVTFFRVFRAETGQSPSDFAASV